MYHLNYEGHDFFDFDLKIKVTFSNLLFIINQKYVF